MLYKRHRHINVFKKKSKVMSVVRCSLTVALVLLGFPQMAPCSMLAPPIIQCDAPVYDFGTRLNTEEIPHTFMIGNKGGSPLIISRIRNGCGCTRSELDKNTILPGESVNLSTRVSIRGHIGPKHVSLYLHSNDPTNPVFQCHISGISIAEVEISPRDVNVTLPPGPVPLETTVNIINLKFQPRAMLNPCSSCCQ
jgi:hypothetical protein